MATCNCDRAYADNDCISRQAVNILVDELARAISDERCCMSRGRSTANIMQDILDLPSIQPKADQEPQTTTISQNATNGDLIMVLFPDISNNNKDSITCDLTNSDWWNTPYKGK